MFFVSQLSVLLEKKNTINALLIKIKKQKYIYVIFIIGNKLRWPIQQKAQESNTEEKSVQILPVFRWDTEK